MSQTNTQDRERAVQMITQRHELQWRIKRTQRRLEAAQGEARQAIQNSLAVDQAALAELTPTLEQTKARMRQEEEHIRRKTDEALRLRDEWRRSQFLNSYPGAAPPDQGQALVLLVGLAVIVATTSAMLLLNR